MRTPNFFLVGAAKAGTSSMQRHLAAHPQIFMCEPKEPEFFSQSARDRTIRYTESTYEYPKDLPQYLRLFRDAGDALIVGDASTGYSQRPRLASAAERIFDFNPDSRILYLVRDPVERAISHYWTAVRWAGERRDMQAALLEDDYYRVVSDYALQIEPYLRLFGPQRVKILTLEALERAPLPAIRSVYSWLGVDADFTPGGDEVLNRTPATICVPRGPRAVHRLRHSRAWNRLSPFVPAAARSAARRLTEVELQTCDVPLTVVDALRDALAEPVLRFESLIGRRVSEWTTCHAAADTTPSPTPSHARAAWGTSVSRWKRVSAPSAGV